MANPITWRNIEGPDPVRALAAFASAASTINDGFSGLKKTFDEYQTGVKNRNTEAFLNALSQFRTPEDLEAAMKSGIVDRLYQQHGNMINPDAREAADKRLGLMLDRAFKKEDQEFQRNTDIRAGEAHDVNMDYGRLRNAQLENSINLEASQHAIDSAIANAFEGIRRGASTPEDATNQVMELYDSLVRRGFNPAQVQASIAKFDPMLTFGAGGFGPDRQRRAAEDAWYRENAPGAPGSVTAVRNTEELGKWIKEIIPDKDVAAEMQSIIADPANTTIGEGDEAVTIPISYLKNAILQSKDPTELFSPSTWADSRADNLKEILKNLREDSEVLQAIRERIRKDKSKIER